MGVLHMAKAKPSFDRQIKDALCEYLCQSHRGEEAAVCSKVLEQSFHLKGSEVRRLINALRCDGKPICSNSAGYFYGANAQEVQNTVTQLSSRVHKITKARDGLMRFISSTPQVE